MAATTEDRYIRQVGAEYPAKLQIGVDGGAVAIPEGVMVTALIASGLAVNGGTASATHVLGVSDAAVDNSSGSDSDLSINLLQGAFWFANGSGGNEVLAADFAQPVYVVDNQTVSKTNNSNTRQIAGVALAVDATLGVLVYISAPMNKALEGEDSDLAADLASITVGNGASMVGVEDAGGHTAQANLEAATQEIYQTILSAQKTLQVPFPRMEKDGTFLAAFADGASPTPGLDVTDSKTVNVRWNNHANPDPVACGVALPQDLDNSADIVVHYMASKTGATIGDAVTFLTEAFFQTVGALHDADADAGGTSSAMTGDAASKTVQEETLTIAAANVPAAPCKLMLTIQPTDGTLGTDDVHLHDVWLEYTPKVMTS